MRRRSAGSSDEPPSISSLYPRMMDSRLLKSCAIPPASWPTASSFCAWRSISSERESASLVWACSTSAWANRTPPRFILNARNQINPANRTTWLITIEAITSRMFPIRLLAFKNSAPKTMGITTAAGINLRDSHAPAPLLVTMPIHPASGRQHKTEDASTRNPIPVCNAIEV